MAPSSSPEELFNWLFEVVDSDINHGNDVKDVKDDVVLEDAASTAAGRITWNVNYQRANGNDLNTDSNHDGWVEAEEDTSSQMDRYRLRAHVHLQKDDIQAVLPIAKVILAATYV